MRQIQSVGRVTKAIQSDGEIDYHDNARFYDFCILQASSVNLPIDDPAAVWGRLCDSTFSRLQADVAQQVDDVDLLPHVSAVLSRVEFELAIQGTDRYGHD